MPTSYYVIYAKVITLCEKFITLCDNYYVMRKVLRYAASQAPTVLSLTYKIVRDIFLLRVHQKQQTVITRSQRDVAKGIIICVWKHCLA